MRKIINILKVNVCSLLAMYLFVFNMPLFAMAVEDEAQLQAGSTIALVEIESYEITEGIIEPGKDATISLVLRNASLTTNAHNVVVTISTSSGMIYPSYGNDNQVFVGTIAPGKTRSAVIPVTINPSFTGNVIDLTCSMSYESRGTRQSNVATVVLPASNGSPLAVKSVDVSSKAAVNGKSLLSVNYVNNSAENITDAELLINGNVDYSSRVIELGTISAGKTYLKDYYITFNQSGSQTIDISLTYTDANGEKVETNLGSYSVVVTEENASNTETVNDNRLLLWGGRAVAIVAAIVAFCMVLVYIKKR